MLKNSHLDAKKEKMSIRTSWRLWITFHSYKPLIICRTAEIQITNRFNHKISSSYDLYINSVTSNLRNFCSTLQERLIAISHKGRLWQTRSFNWSIFSDYFLNHHVSVLILTSCSFCWVKCTSIDSSRCVVYFGNWFKDLSSSKLKN